METATATKWSKKVTSRLRYFDTAEPGRPSGVYRVDFPYHTPPDVYNDWPPKFDGIDKPHTYLNVSPEDTRRHIVSFYDASGNPVYEGRSLRLGGTSQYSFLARRYTYDLWGRLQHAWWEHQSQPPAVPDAALQYDLLDRIRAMGSGQGAYLSYFDHFGDRVQYTDAKKHQTSYEFNDFGELTSITKNVTRADGVTQALVTRFGYTGLGELETVVDPDDRSYHYDYSPIGLLESATLPFGAWTYDWTPGGRLEKETRPNGSSITYSSFDDAGRPRHMSEHGVGICSDHATADVEYGYDERTDQIGHLGIVKGPGYELRQEFDGEGLSSRGRS
jgi:YD repeat-containing protein